MICKIWKKSKLNSENIWKIQKKIVKWFGKYGRKVSWIVIRYGKYGRNPSWIVKWYGKYGSKASRVVKRYGKYRRKEWNDFENMEEK
jgi:hypothetical protein